MNRELTIVKSCLNLASRTEGDNRKLTGDAEWGVAGLTDKREQKPDAEPNDSRSFIIYERCRFKTIYYEIVGGIDGTPKHSPCFGHDNKSIYDDFKESSQSENEKLTSNRTFHHRSLMNSAAGSRLLVDRDYVARSKGGVDLGEYSKTRSADCLNSEIEILDRRPSEYRTKCGRFDGAGYYNDEQQPREAAATLMRKRAKFDRLKNRLDDGNERAKPEGRKLQVPGRYLKFDHVKSRLDNRNERARPQGRRLNILGRYPKFDHLKSRLDNRNGHPRPTGHRLKEYKGPYRDFSRIKPRVPTVAVKKSSNEWPPPNDEDEYYEEVGLLVSNSPINESGDLLVPLQQHVPMSDLSRESFIESTDDDGIQLLEWLKLLHQKDAYYVRKVNNIGIACWRPDTERTLNFDQIKQFNRRYTCQLFKGRSV